MIIRSGYSWRFAYGHLKDVAERLKELQWSYAPLSDRSSTFGHTKWTRHAREANMLPIYGIELAVVPEKNKPPRERITDYWAFFAQTNLSSLHQIVASATTGVETPELTYEEAFGAEDVIKISGSRTLLSKVKKRPNLFIQLSPATPIGLYREAKRCKFDFIATSDNVYPRLQDRESFRIALGKRADTQSYPQHILSDEEWHAATWRFDEDDRKQAIENRDAVLKTCTAALEKAEIFTPEKKLTLREMCIKGAVSKSINLKDKVYADRLDRELKLIGEKKFEDYFYIITDLIAWAKKRMIVGPARGSSCGSLVCYLLDITTVDPLKFDLIFERFIDITRSDLPDIDIDFSETKRDLVFDYVEKKYGTDHVARLGTVITFQPKSILAAAGAALRIPQWRLDKVADTMIVRSSGDSRAGQQLEDTIKETEEGKRIAEDFPNIGAAAILEDHPTTAGKHAAGICITKEPINRYVAIDKRTNSTMCDKYDAEQLNFLKIDMLGLTQLSVFERTLELLGNTALTSSLNVIPLNDKDAFRVLNEHKYSGIFQFNGKALQSLAKQIEIDRLNDIVALTALARPGPLANGGANDWVSRRMGRSPITYPHPAFKPYLKDTYGVVVYQETVMQIGRQLGDLSWEDVTALRKAMSKSLGAEYFNRWGDKWKEGAKKHGIPNDILDKAWDDLCQFGCLSGDTVLINPHPNQHNGNKTFTIKELFIRKGLAPRGKHQSKKQQKILCYQNDGIRPASVVEIYYSGKRETWEVSVDSGEKIRTTMEHKFLCSNGIYKTLKELKSSDAILMNGGVFKNYRPKKGVGKGGGTHEYHLKKSRGEPLLNVQIKKLKDIYTRCQKCKRKPYQHTHHINLNYTDHRWENLLPVCTNCHRSLHKNRPAFSRGYQPKISHIVSISKPKIEDTYDIAMPSPHNNFIANNFIVHNSWGFNKSHAVAYGILSYYCAYFKAHYPVEFAAAALDFEPLPLKQIAILRELQKEGIPYKSVDAKHSTDKWGILGTGTKKSLLGPLTNIKGIGIKTVDAIIASRENGKKLPPGLTVKLAQAKTSIDSLFPIADAIAQLAPQFKSEPITIEEAQCGSYDHSVIIIGVLTRIAPRDENDPAKVARRRGRLIRPWRGNTWCLNMFVRDDSDEIFVKISHRDYAELAKPILAEARVGKSLYAFKGHIPPDFRMLSVENVRYIGELDERGRGKEGRLSNGERRRTETAV